MDEFIPGLERFKMAAETKTPKKGALGGDDDLQDLMEIELATKQARPQVLLRVALKLSIAGTLRRRGTCTCLATCVAKETT